MAPVTLRKLVKRYGALEVVHGIDLEVKDREFIALVGPSGCGKSTTLRMIAGLEEVSGGAIEIGGRKVNDLPPRARNISMVFQSYALYPHMTVAENMGFSLKIAGRSADEIKTRVDEAAAILDLGHLLERRPSQLSGGQRQRVAMGRAIVRQPDVFLFDEPLSNLDAKLRMEMRTELKRLHQMLKTTVVYVTHDQIEAMTLATRIAVMRDGRIEQLATPEEIYDRPATLYVAGFVGSPPMNILDAEVTASGLKLDGCEEVLPLPAAFDGTALAGRRVKVGIRPEAMRLAAESEDPQLTADIEVVELTGPELVTTATVGRQRITACLPPRTALGTGSVHAFTFDETAMHLFDPESGRSLKVG